jgi:hypothetical protein
LGPLVLPGFGVGGEVVAVDAGEFGADGGEEVAAFVVEDVDALGGFGVVEDPDALFDVEGGFDGEVFKFVDGDAGGFLDGAPAVFAGNAGQEQVELAGVGDAPDRFAPGGFDFEGALAVEAAVRAVVVVVAPAVDDGLQFGGGQRQFDFGVFGVELVGELLAFADGLAFGDVVADVAGEQFEDVVVEGADGAFDVAFALGLEGGAALVVDVEGFQDAGDVGGLMFKKVFSR